MMLTRLCRRPVISLYGFMSTSHPQTGVAASSRSGSSAAKMGASEQGSEVTGNSEMRGGEASTANSNSNSSSSGGGKGSGILPLPAPPSPQEQQGGSDSSSGRGDDVTTLRVGESLRLDALGPLVVNTDGSMARVGNWAGMTELEREATLRLLGKRNRQRLEALKARKDAEETGNGTSSGA